MKLKTFSLLVIFLFVAACSPQVQTSEVSDIVPEGETSEVLFTPPPPTSTPIPTPTLHPEFIALQQAIAAPGQGLRVDKTGVMTVMVGDEPIPVESGSIKFTSDGVEIDGYELNEDGEWAEAMSKAEQAARDILDTYNLTTDEYTITEIGEDTFSVTSNKTGKEILQSDKYGIRYGLEFGLDTIAKSSCDSRMDFVPSSDGRMLASNTGVDTYFNALFRDLTHRVNLAGKFWHVLIDRDRRCWGGVVNNGNSLIYRDGDKEAVVLRLIKLSEEEIIGIVFGR